MTNKLTQFTALVDISAVKTDSTKTELDEIIKAAKQYKFKCVFALPSFAEYLIEQLKSTPEVLVGGVVGFPSGGDTTASKVFQAKELCQMGCGEIDMVMNIGKLKSGLYDEVVQDILAVKQAVGNLPLKVIIEAPLLSDNEIVKAGSLIAQCDVAFIKSGTGWSGTTTPRHVELMGEGVNHQVAMKVAGGVRHLAQLRAMQNQGVTRFGIGYKAALSILEELTCES